MILTLNAGSSSLKFALFRPETAAGGTFSVAGELQRIGADGGAIEARDGEGRELVARRLPLRDHAAALAALLDWIEETGQTRSLTAVGHRLVHGGSEFREPVLITPTVLGRIISFVALAPNHLPSEIAAIEAVGRRHPDLPQVACFDTAFHSSLPAIARQLGLPRGIADRGVVRYGFHGLSYEFVVAELARQAGREAAQGRVIAAHLGSGASLCAIHGGRSIDTSMGFTPIGGIVMGTRSGDLDPGALLYLITELGRTPAEIAEMVEKRSGLLGISGSSSDMRDLLRDDRTASREAVDLFCYRAKKQIGAYAAALGGIDTLVFTGGIGAHMPEIRERICEGLAFLGIELDREANRTDGPLVSRPSSPVAVRAIPTDEERVIAAHTASLLAQHRIEKD